MAAIGDPFNLTAGSGRFEAHTQDPPRRAHNAVAQSEPLVALRMQCRKRLWPTRTWRVGCPRKFASWSTSNPIRFRILARRPLAPRAHVRHAFSDLGPRPILVATVRRPSLLP